VPITLKDGTHIPKGARLAWANADILDESASPEFDPMRSYRKRRETGELNKHGAGQPDQTNLHFGYGNQACPGRFFAIGEIKLLMTKLLSEFEFKFKEGQRRPRTFYADENVFVDPTATLLMRKREIPATIVD
jgi:cytochrome P450